MWTQLREHRETLVCDSLAACEIYRLQVFEHPGNYPQTRVADICFGNIQFVRLQLTTFFEEIDQNRVVHPHAARNIEGGERRHLLR